MQWECCPDKNVEEEEPQRPFRRDTYHYVLPSHLIAQHPLPRRDESRLMVLGRGSGALHHSTFRNLRDHLREGDFLVVNESRVFPARLLGHKPSGGKVDLLLLQPCDAEAAALSWWEAKGSESREWECLIQSSRRPKQGQAFTFSHGLQGRVSGESEGGVWRVRFNLDGKDLLAHLESHGLVPLPPYIRRGRRDSGSEGSSEVEGTSQDRDRYQTVFARKIGSVAAPTAGFHFTEPLCRSLEASGISFGRITLHVGQATFLPIRARDIRRHRVWPERYCVSEETAEKIRNAKREGRRLVAVGTTVVRCLESLVSERGGVEEGEGWASLYIVPGHRFKLVDAMITNFHLPGTSLLVLVCAFSQRQHVLKAYREAIRSEYRFFSYGDCMLVQ
jgi:S-adenosylmethionine:tRNA ribosyltransferase-isomerase